ncbi:hypothetical protein [Kitasatospora sp. NPDC093806]|uniref:hypothetical protein n=1 Tax=Kitasatospora sp. NPDC093806 TaxID=3155075 RepID=UPI0034471CA5
MTISRRSLLRTAVAAVPVLTVGTLATTPASAATPGWQTTPIPNPDTVSVADISMAGASAGWAVGNRVESYVIFMDPIEFNVPAAWSWNGTQWVDIPNTNFASTGQLTAVNAAGAADVWAVGSDGNDVGIASHWDGSGWTKTTVLNAAGGKYHPRAVSGSGTNTWIVGSIPLSFTTSTAAAARWNGTSWDQVTLPVPAGSSRFNAVRVVGPNDVWVAGDYRASASGSLYKAFLLHWDGTSWTQVPAPVYPNLDVQVFELVVKSPTEVWLAGSTGRFNPTGPALPWGAYATRWNGSSWTGTRPPAAIDPQYFVGLTTRGTELWGAGTAGSARVQRWDGSAWSAASAPLPVVYPNGITTGPDGTTWLFGSGATDQNARLNPFIARLPAS